MTIEGNVKEAKPRGDFWAENDSIFVHFGKRYGVDKTGKTILVAEKPQKDAESNTTLVTYSRPNYETAQATR